MELAEYQYQSDGVKMKVTVCDANITRYLSGKHNELHVCFLQEQSHVPIMGLATYSYDDIWTLDINRFGETRLPKWLEEEGLVKGDTIQVQFIFNGDVMYLRLGKNRQDWTSSLMTKFNKSIKVSFVVETAKENFFVIRDDLYLDYVLNGKPRKLGYCASCADENKDRLAVAKCGHYMCMACWNKWTKGKFEVLCYICSEKVHDHVIARFRDSPCPVDHCRSGDGNRDHVLVPCGCIVRCMPEKRIGESKIFCPYELCSRPVKEKWVLY
ncbi:unnamed protein product [Angiostrongylus costaricensis]|uniref:RING-type domain-containing protein n=1 Tax=Angiostrongylus costaricensis TaxID=334426 RepID=A0A158PGC6_ANGCS|nr:unnamed protein product [Angiostrongylus costaricensis]